MQILETDSKPKDCIEKSSEAFDERDRAFLMEIVYGVLRNMIALDWILSGFLKNPAKAGSYTINNLRSAVYQIFYMRTPDHAAVSEAVELEKSAVGAGKPTLVNAVLRNILRRKQEFTPPFRFDSPIEDISINHSCPKWLAKRWIGRFGEDEARLLAEASNKIPPLTIRANTLRISREALSAELSERGIVSSPAAFSPDGLHVVNTRSFGDLAFASGLFQVQDEASQLISYLVDPGSGQRVLDACAAPGGKTTHMAQLMCDTGEITAVEKTPERFERLRSNTAELGIRSVRFINRDIADVGDIGKFDRILLDAPCSSLGVIRRNPDVKYRHRERNLNEFRSRQYQLLKNAANLLEDDGRLVYSVCSTEPEEGELVVRDFLKTNPEFRIIDSVPYILKEFTADGFFRTYPHKHNMDGFFGAALCRKK